MASKITPTTNQNSKAQYPETYGPIHDRKCRDVFFLLLFIVYWVGLVWISLIAFKSGDPNRLLYGTDSDGNLCGYNNSNSTYVTGTAVDATNLTLLFYFNPTDPTFSYRRCVAECPNVNSLPNTTNAVCKYNATITGSDDTAKQISLTQLILSGDCTPFLYASQDVLKRCFPSVLAVIPDILANSSLLNSTSVNDTTTNTTNLDAAQTAVAQVQAARSASEKIISDVLFTWQSILIGAGIAVVLSLLYVIVIRFTAAFFVYLIIVLIEVGLAFCTWWFYFQWQNQTTILASTPRTVLLDIQQKLMLALFILCAVLLAVLTVILIFARKRIKIAVAILKESARAIGAMPLIFFFPLFILIAQAAVTFYWLAVEVFLLTSNISTVQVADNVISDKNLGIFFQLAWFFGFLWTTVFLDGVLQTSIAGAIATWYWTMDKRRLPGFPVLYSFLRVLIYHLGSIAFGSLLIAIIKFIRFILMYVQKKIAGKSKTLKILLACCICLIWLFEKILKFITRRAYIEIAIYGMSFCAAARAAFIIIVTNALRLAFVDGISFLIMFLGKLLICGGVFTAGYFRFRDDTNVFYWQVPSALAAVLSWIVAVYFMNVYDMAIDTIFICFCEDCERNNGSYEKPYYMSKELLDIVNKHNLLPENRLAQTNLLVPGSSSAAPQLAQPRNPNDLRTY